MNASMATVNAITTAEQLYAATDLGRCELVRGELIMMSPAGFEHGRITMDIALRLAEFVHRNALGVVLAAETGFVLRRDPDTVRAPDVAFVRAERLGERSPKGFFPGPPDLAVEVLSPDDRPGRCSAKVRDWLDAGCREVWVVDPADGTITIYQGSDSRTLSGDDVLTSPLLAGFTLPLTEVLPR
jgi:Uma2 family endonuclease